MKKIVFLLPSVRGGGAERVVIDTMRYLNRSLFDITLLLVQNDGVYWSEIPKWVKVVTILEKNETVKFNLIKLFTKLFDVIRKNDIIIGSLELYTTYLAVIAGKLFKKKVIGWVHCDLKLRLLNMGWIERIINYFFINVLYPLLDSIVAVSCGAKNSVSTLIKNKIKNLYYVYNPIDFFRIERELEFEDTYTNWHNIDFSIPTIINVGRLEKEKNQELLIKAHVMLKEKGIKNNLIILGEGPERENLECLIEKLDVYDSVFLVGFQKNPYIWMKRADVFALSSIFEGFGLVLVEAMYLGLPVISTDCPSGPKEILDNGKYGILVKINNQIEMCKEMEKLLRDKDLVEKLKYEGFRRAEDFTALKGISKLEKIFLSCE